MRCLTWRRWCAALSVAAGLALAAGSCSKDERRFEYSELERIVNETPLPQGANASPAGGRASCEDPASGLGPYVSRSARLEGAQEAGVAFYRDYARSKAFRVAANSPTMLSFELPDRNGQVVRVVSSFDRPGEFTLRAIHPDDCRL